jgi:hypothetical protein
MKDTAAIEYLEDLRKILVEKGYKCTPSAYFLLITAGDEHFEVKYISGEWLYHIYYTYNDVPFDEYFESTKDAARFIIARAEKKYYLDNCLKFIGQFGNNANVLIYLRSTTTYSNDITLKDVVGNYKEESWNDCLKIKPQLRWRFPVKNLDISDKDNIKITLDYDKDDWSDFFYETTNSISLAKVLGY